MFKRDNNPSSCHVLVLVVHHVSQLLFHTGIIVMQYLQNVSSRVALGSEVVYQFGNSVPGNQMAIYTLAGRYTGNSTVLLHCVRLSGVMFMNVVSITS